MSSWRPVSLCVTVLVLCLASLAPAVAADPRFVPRGAEVLDTTTGLTWARCSIGQHWRAGAGCVGAAEKMTFAEAQIQANLNWRLPTAEELTTLRTATGHTRANGAVHYMDEEAFPPSTEESSYWSSSGVTPVDGVAVTFFDEHPAFITNRLELYAVRLVKRKAP